MAFADTKLSVIIPTLNRRKLLAETLVTIFAQTLPPQEVIVVDNGSRDGTVEWLEAEYGDMVICIENSSGNQTPGKARNLGLNVASGNFVKFFDSDDLMTGNTLQVQYEVLSKSGKGFVYSPYILAGEQTPGVWHQSDVAIMAFHPFDAAYPLHYHMAVHNLFIPIPAMLFRRDLLNEVGPWREDVVASEDWDYLWRISLLEP